MAIVNNCPDGIFSLYLNGVKYVVWTNVKVVRRYVKDELIKRFPGRLIVRELNQIDYTVPEENLPIEIQATIASIDNREHRKPMIRYSQWEKDIRTQIEQNIIAYNNCWFFFDSELLGAMKCSSRNTSINLDWFRKFMKEGKLKVFTVSYDGVIEEKEYKDFDFLAEISQTCPVAAETDDIVLNKNKMKIYTSVIKGYGFTQEEIDKFDYDHEEYCKISNVEDRDSTKSRIDFLVAQVDERPQLYGRILTAIGSLHIINSVLDRKPNRRTSSGKYHAKILGIFDTRGGGRDNILTKFVDRFHVCKYFPGYMRNKGIWNKLNGRNLNWRQFANVITGKNDVICGIDHYFNNEDGNITENMDKENNDQYNNIELFSKDQIVTTDIKTKQRKIEDAWA